MAPRARLIVVAAGLLGATLDRSAMGSDSGERAPSFVHEEVVITATRIDSLADAVPQAITVVDAESIARRSPGLLADLMRGETGVFVQQTTAGQATPIIRGLTGSSILMLVDGMRLSSSLFRPAPNQYFSLVDPYHVERIEIVRGSASTLYGSDALGGVVHVMTPTARFEGEEWQLAGRFLGQLGSADTSGVSRTALAAGRRGVSLAGGFTYQTHGDLRGGGGIGLQSPTAFDVVAGDGKLLVEDELQELILSAQYLRQPETPRYDALVPGFGQSAPESEVFVFAPNDRLFRHGRYQRVALAPIAEVLDVNLAYQQIDDDRRVRDRGSADEQHERNRSRLVGLTLQAIAQPSGLLVVTYGTDLYLDHVTNSRESVDPRSGAAVPRPARFPSGARQKSVGGYVEGSLHWQRWRMVGGVRLSYIGVDLPEVVGRSPAISRSFVDLTGNLGLEYEILPGLSLVSNAGRGFRAPNVFDFSQLGPRPGNRYAQPTADLEPEISVSVDAGVKAALGGLSAQLYGFWLRVDERIEALPTDVVLADGRTVVESANVNRVDLAGVELGGQMELGGGGRPFGSLNYTWGEERFTGGVTMPADRVPPLNGQLGLSLELLAGAWIEPYLRFATEQGRLSERDRTDPRIDPEGTPGWVTVNLRTGIPVHSHLDLRLALDNLLNAAYREHGSGVDAPGLGFVLAMESRW